MAVRQPEVEQERGSMRMLIISACGLAIGFAFTLSFSPGMNVNASNTSPPPVPAAIMKDGKVSNRKTNLPNKGRRTSRQATLFVTSATKKTSGTGNVILPPLHCFDAAKIEQNPACRNPTMHKSSTIDWKFQSSIAKYMRKRPVTAAAFVAIDIKTGAIRALLSHEPGSKATSREALSARAPAASVFKIITSVALMRRGLNANSTVCSHGGARKIGLSQLKDSPKHDRCEPLSRAFAFSRNSAFAKLSARYLDVSSLTRAATSLGFNAKIPFSLPLEESRVNIPRTKLARARTAAGFSDARLSPVHGALIAATIARNGSFILPYLSQGNQSRHAPVRVVSRKIAREMRILMRATVRQGTGRRTLGRTSISSGAKSGSLSSSRHGKRHHNTWMVGYFPEKNPKIAYAALVVNEGVWHIRAGNLARAALDSYASLHPSFPK